MEPVGVDRMSALSLTLVRLPRTMVSADARAGVDVTETAPEEDEPADSCATDPFAVSRVEQAGAAAIAMRIADVRSLVMRIAIPPSLQEIISSNPRVSGEVESAVEALTAPCPACRLPEARFGERGPCWTS